MLLWHVFNLATKQLCNQRQELLSVLLPFCIKMVGIILVGIKMDGIIMVGIILVGIKMDGIIMVGIKMVGIKMDGIEMVGIIIVSIILMPVVM
jgi:hypothetical protein